MLLGSTYLVPAELSGLLVSTFSSELRCVFVLPWRTATPVALQRKCWIKYEAGSSMSSGEWMGPSALPYLPPRANQSSWSHSGTALRARQTWNLGKKAFSAPGPTPAVRWTFGNRLPHAARKNGRLAFSGDSVGRLGRCASSTDHARPAFRLNFWLPVKQNPQPG